MTGWKEDGTFGGGGNKDQRVAVMKALADWWVTGGGKEAGKLKYFADQPLLAHPQITDRHLLVYAFEDWLKRWFFNLLQVLEVSQSWDKLMIGVLARHLTVHQDASSAYHIQIIVWECRAGAEFAETGREQIGG